MQGQALYSIETKYLWDFSMSDETFENRVFYLGQKPGCSDGLQFMNGNLYFGNIQNSALGVINAIETAENLISIQTPFSSSQLNWIDTFAIDFQNPYGLYFTSNRLNLFFTNAIDWTGQSGPNMHIFYLDTSTAVVPNSIGGNDESLPTGSIIAIVSSIGIFMCFVGIAVYRWMAAKQMPLSSKV